MLRGAVGQKGLQELPSAAAGLAAAKGLSPVVLSQHRTLVCLHAGCCYTAATLSIFSACRSPLPAVPGGTGVSGGGGDSRRGAGGFWQRAEAENGNAALEKGRGAQGRVRWAGGERRGREGGREEGKDILILLSPIKARPPNAPLVLYSVTLHVTAVGDTECAEWCVVPGL